jgi:5-methylthioadenosine/S-adenosylhomocysteine deaminase
MTRIALYPSVAVTCDDNFQVIDDAAIHIENKRIVFVGAASAAPPFDAEETIRGSHLVALPGLVNTHTHAAMTLLRGYADDMALEPWLQTRIWPFESHLDGRDVYVGTRLACAEMLCGGTTCCADMYHFYEDGVQAFIESGMRAVPGGVLLGFLPEPERRIANAIAFVREYSNAAEGRITPALAPHSLYTCDHSHWKAMIEGAHDLGCLIETHAAETLREVADVTAQWGANPIQTLKNIGALEVPLLAAHCVHVDERDLEEMRESGFRVAHNPTSNLKLASGFAPSRSLWNTELLPELAPMARPLTTTSTCGKKCDSLPCSTRPQRAMLPRFRRSKLCLWQLVKVRAVSTLKRKLARCKLANKLTSFYSTSINRISRRVTM